ncbi:MAG: acyl carrier protein [Deltaproteobacteria bacterium]|jgi:acyl carrier protein|nr:acyl carrier protein [Deltaproteobacteria bacterium]
MRTEEEIIKLFKEAVREVDHNVKLGEMTAKTELSAVGLDSVMTMEVIGVMEEKLNVRFPDEDLATLKNMGDLTTLIRKLS